MLVPLISGLAIGCIYGLVAIGFSMIYRAMRLVNFAQGDIMMVGAFAGYTLLQIAPWLPFWLVLAGAVCATAVLGAVIERIAFRPAMRRRAGPITLVLLTLGVGILLSNGARLIWGANPVVYDIPLAHQVVVLGGYPLPLVYFYIFATMAALLAGLHLFFTRTWLGIALRAAADDRDSAAMLGIDAGHAASVSFAMASGIAAAAGVLYAPIVYVSFNMGLVGVKGFAAAVVGSLGSIQGAVLGGLLIGVGETFGAQWIATEYQDSIAFAVMIGILLLRPSGLRGVGAP